MAVIETKDLTKVYRMGNTKCARCAACRSTSRRASSSPSPGRPVPANRRSCTSPAVSIGRRAATTSSTAGTCRSSKDELAGAQQEDRLRLPGLQPAHAHHGARQRRVATALSASKKASSAERHKRALAALDSVGLDSAIITCRTSCPAASSSAWRSRARWSTSRRSSWPTSRPATSTRAPASRSWASSSGSTANSGITILLITHEMDIAEYGTRLIRFRDGRVVADQPVLHRRNAADELAALPPPEPDLIPPPENRRSGRALGPRRGLHVVC